MTETKHKKVLFKFHSDLHNEIVVETMWAVVIDENRGIYSLDNIPFNGPMIATGDEFYPEPCLSEKHRKDIS